MILDPQTSKPGQRTVSVCNLFFYWSPGDNNTWSMPFARIYTWYTKQSEQGNLSFNGTGKCNAVGEGVTLQLTNTPSRGWGVKLLLVISCCIKGDKLQAWVHHLTCMHTLLLLHVVLSWAMQLNDECVGPLGGTSCMKRLGMFIISTSGVNHRYWSHLDVLDKTPLFKNGIF